MQFDYDLLNRIGRLVVEGLEKLGEEHSCILSTTVLIEVLSRLGISDAYALTVRPWVLNPTYAEKFRETGRMPSAEELEQWKAEGAASVIVGHSEAPDDSEWPGHLVAVIPDFVNGLHAVIDLTITQANVPEWDIQLPPLTLAIPEAFVEGRQEFRADVNRCLVIYMAFPTDTSYDTAPIWKKKSKRNNIADQVMAGLLE